MIYYNNGLNPGLISVSILRQWKDLERSQKQTKKQLMNVSRAFQIP